ncbi:MAG: hypothetical protein ACRDJO_02305 [Actinomycetota bacterium]
MSAHGAICFKRKQIYVGRRWAGGRVRVIEAGPLIHIYYGEQLARELVPDPTRAYQGVRRKAVR